MSGKAGIGGVSDGHVMHSGQLSLILHRTRLSMFARCVSAFVSSYHQE